MSVVVEPARVYLGGMLGHALGPRLLPRNSQLLGERWPFASAWPPPALVFDGVGPYAATIGAALDASDSTYPASPDR